MFKQCPTALHLETLNTAFLKLQCPCESSEDLDKMQMPMWSGMGLRLCISNQPSGNADDAGPWTTV